MDPMTIGAMMQGASGLLGALKPSTPQAPNQRADGYSMGGAADGTSSGGASGGSTGGAYGGAWSQANTDGSNWTVSLGSGIATGGGRSGGNGGLSPTQSNTGAGGVTPQNPFAGGSPLSSGSMLPLVFVGLAVFMLMKK